MNWKDVPQLFANGKFKIKYIYFDEEIIEVLDGDMADGVKKYNEQDYTLIARKIDNLTDKESKNLFDYQGFSNPMKGAFSSITKKTMGIKSFNDNPTVKSFIYLLSIGVYPFSQSHFGETVIDINSL